MKNFYLSNSPNSYQVIIFGGAGFIGSHLTKKLVQLGHQVSVVDNLSRGKKEIFSSILPKINFFETNIFTDQKLKEKIEGNQIVFNLAALNTGVDYDMGRTQLMFEDNMLLQLLPLRAAGQTTSVKKFVQISSASVYSRQVMEHQVPTPENALEGEPEPSKLGYGLAKRMGEYLAQWYAQNTTLETVCARFINVYGEDDNFDEKGHFIPVMIRKFLTAKQSVRVFGSGNQQRSFLYVEDAVDALLLLAEQGNRGEAYNVDAGEEYSVKQVVNLIAKLTQKTDLSINYDTTKPEGSQRRLLDNSKLVQLGWEPQVRFETGLQRTVHNISETLKKELQT